ncbi:MAG: hypothetical protein GKR87_01795 [Kiritimatiellae bacterium]|nr:hypothetical protein [Kiritimatiellia bacterium]
MSIATAEIRRRAIDAYKMGKGSQADIASSYRVDLRTFQRGLSRFSVGSLVSAWALSFQRNRTDRSPTAWASLGPLQRKAAQGVGSTGGQTSRCNA